MNGSRFFNLGSNCMCSACYNRGSKSEPSLVQLVASRYTGYDIATLANKHAGTHTCTYTHTHTQHIYSLQEGKHWQVSYEFSFILVFVLSQQEEQESNIPFAFFRILQNKKDQCKISSFKYMSTMVYSSLIIGRSSKLRMTCIMGQDMCSFVTRADTFFLTFNKT